MKLAWNLYIAVFCTAAIGLSLMTLVLLPGIYTTASAVITAVLVVVNLAPWKRSNT